MTDSRFDARGCLTPPGLAAIRRAPPGAAPAELAGHLAVCGRCQDRLLAVERTEGPRRNRPPSPMRAAVIGLAILLLGVLALASLWWRAASRG